MRYYFTYVMNNRHTPIRKTCSSEAELIKTLDKFKAKGHKILTVVNGYPID